MFNFTLSRCRLPALGVLWALFMAPVAVGQDLDCAACHDTDAVASSTHGELACTDCHGEVTPAHRRQGLEPPGDAVCSGCHRRPGRELDRSVHAEQAGCVDCHGAPHEIHKVDDLASAVSPVNQIKYCGGCHDDPESLVDGYLTSEHGKALLLSGLINAPSCSDCHGAHNIIATDNDKASTSHLHSPETCGACHALLLDEWKAHSAHGQAWEAGNTGPVCVDCHASHEIADPTMAKTRLASAGVCGECHKAYLTTFRDSFHGKANDLGFVEGATCSDCHTPHSSLPA
jgi:nitrate/TMAO reductase-like tetraheme cytochrome c subunit